MSQLGQKRKSGPAILTSVLPSTADIRQRGGHVPPSEVAALILSPRRQPRAGSTSGAAIVWIAAFLTLMAAFFVAEWQASNLQLPVLETGARPLELHSPGK
jgi:hypothetical protein